MGWKLDKATSWMVHIEERDLRYRLNSSRCGVGMYVSVPPPPPNLSSSREAPHPCTRIEKTRHPRVCAPIGCLRMHMGQGHTNQLCSPRRLISTSYITCMSFFFFQLLSIRTSDEKAKHHLRTSYRPSRRPNPPHAKLSDGEGSAHTALQIASTIWSHFK